MRYEAKTDAYDGTENTTTLEAKDIYEAQWIAKHWAGGEGQNPRWTTRADNKGSYCMLNGSLLLIVQEVE